MMMSAGRSLEVCWSRRSCPLVEAWKCAGRDDHVRWSKPGRDGLAALASPRVRWETDGGPKELATVGRVDGSFIGVAGAGQGDDVEEAAATNLGRPTGATHERQPFGPAELRVPTAEAKSLGNSSGDVGHIVPTPDRGGGCCAREEGVRGRRAQARRLSRSRSAARTPPRPRP